MFFSGVLCGAAMILAAESPDPPGAAFVPISPRLEAIRYHLRAGVVYADLVKKIGRPDLDLGDSVLHPFYFLDGKYRGMWLELAFDDDRLQSARVYDLKLGKVVEPVRVVPEPKGPRRE